MSQLNIISKIKILLKQVFEKTVFHIVNYFSFKQSIYKILIAVRFSTSTEREQKTSTKEAIQIIDKTNKNNNLKYIESKHYTIENDIKNNLITKNTKKKIIIQIIIKYI